MQYVHPTGHESGGWRLRLRRGFLHFPGALTTHSKSELRDALDLQFDDRTPDDKRLYTTADNPSTPNRPSKCQVSAFAMSRYAEIARVLRVFRRRLIVAIGGQVHQLLRRFLEASGKAPNPRSVAPYLNPVKKPGDNVCDLEHFH